MIQRYTEFYLKTYMMDISIILFSLNYFIYKIEFFKHFSFNLEHESYNPDLFHKKEEKKICKEG